MLCTGETPTGALYPTLGSSTEEEQVQRRLREDDQGDIALLTSRQTE